MVSSSVSASIYFFGDFLSGLLSLLKAIALRINAVLLACIITSLGRAIFRFFAILPISWVRLDFVIFLISSSSMLGLSFTYCDGEFSLGGDTLVFFSEDRVLVDTMSSLFSFVGDFIGLFFFVEESRFVKSRSRCFFLRRELSGVAGIGLDVFAGDTVGMARCDFGCDFFLKFNLINS